MHVNLPQIGNYLYLFFMGLILLIKPNSFIKNSFETQTLSFVNQQLFNLLETEYGLRLVALFHIFLLLVTIKNIRVLQYVACLIYGIFMIMIGSSLFFDGYGQVQSQRLERFGYQCGIFSFILYFNLPEYALKKNQEKKVDAVVNQNEINNNSNEKQTTNENKQVSKSNKNKGGKQKNE